MDALPCSAPTRLAAIMLVVKKASRDTLGSPSRRKSQSGRASVVLPCGHLRLQCSQRDDLREIALHFFQLQERFPIRPRDIVGRNRQHCRLTALRTPDDGHQGALDRSHD